MSSSDSDAAAREASLLAAHAALHDGLEVRLYDILARLVHLDVDGALSLLASFTEVLQAHMAWEDERVLPTYRTVAPADGPGRADHVAGDHVILMRNLETARADVANLASATLTLREVLARLPSVYRVLAVLEHHTLREQKNVYPAIARAWSQADVDDAVHALTALVERAPGT